MHLAAFLPRIQRGPGEGTVEATGFVSRSEPSRKVGFHSGLEPGAPYGLT